jgi:hypothetical protein
MIEPKIGMSLPEWSEAAWQAWVRKDLTSLSLDEGDCGILFHRLMEESEWRFNQSVEYFYDRPEWVREELTGHLARLSRLEVRWSEEERFEWCAQVRDVQLELLESWAEWL